MIATMLVYDATHSNIRHLPPGRAAGYVTGSLGVAWTAADFAAHHGAVHIDQSPILSGADKTADVLDVESGAATPGIAAPWVKAARAGLHHGTRPGQRHPAVYCSRSNVTPVVNALIAGGITSGVGLWIADWNNDQHQAAAEVAGAGGPFPVIGRQFRDAGFYDVSVFSVPWITGRQAGA